MAKKEKLTPAREPWLTVKNRRKPWANEYPIMAWNFCPLRHVHVKSSIGYTAYGRFNPRRLLSLYGFVVMWALKKRSWLQILGIAAAIISALSLALMALLTLIRP